MIEGALGAEISGFVAGRVGLDEVELEELATITKEKGVAALDELAGASKSDGLGDVAGPDDNLVCSSIVDCGVSFVVSSSLGAHFDFLSSASPTVIFMASARAPYLGRWTDDLHDICFR